MDISHKSDDEKLSSPEEEIQLSAAEESAIEECLTDPEGSLSGVDLNIFTDSPTNVGKTKKSMAKRKEERKNFKYLTTAARSDDEEESSHQSSSLSSFSNEDSNYIDRRTSPTMNTGKILDDFKLRSNVIRYKATLDYLKRILSTGDTNNVMASNNEVVTEDKHLIDVNEGRTNLTDVPENHQYVLLTPGRLSSTGEELNSHFLETTINTSQIPKEDLKVKVPVGKQLVTNIMKEDAQFQAEIIPSTSKNTNVIKYNNENAQNRESLMLLMDVPKIEYDLNEGGVTENEQTSHLTPRILPRGKTIFEEKHQMSDEKTKQVESWVQNILDRKIDIEKNGLEDEVQSKWNNIFNSVEVSDNAVVTKTNTMTIEETFENKLLKDLQEHDHLARKESDSDVRRGRKRSSSPLYRSAFSNSAPKKKMRKRKRIKNPENHHIYTFFSSMADLVSTFSYDSTLAAKSKVTEVLKEMEKELIEWHNDPSPDKPMADYKMSDEDIQLISKKLAYLPYVY